MLGGGLLERGAYLKFWLRGEGLIREGGLIELLRYSHKMLYQDKLERQTRWQVFLGSALSPTPLNLLHRLSRSVFGHLRGPSFPLGKVFDLIGLPKSHSQKRVYQATS